MLTDDTIRTGWQFILGREPNSPEVYERFRELPNVAALRRVLMDSPEFRQRHPLSAKPVGRHILSTELGPETVVQQRILDAMFERIQEQWAKLGESEPYWSVLTADDYKASEIERNKEKFFRTGSVNVDVVLAALSRTGCKVPDDGECVELGSGVGRVSIPLSRHFKRLHGYDVSPGNLRLAGENAERFGATNISFNLIRRIRDYDAVPNFDFFFSVIVLQHNPPPVQRYILEKIISKANPGALLYFQVQTYASKYSFSPDTYLGLPPATLEMHILPQAAVFEVLAAERCRVLEVMEDNPTNHPDWTSTAFLARKLGR